VLSADELRGVAAGTSGSGGGYTQWQ
jgi:hypothetical protein